MWPLNDSRLAVTQHITELLGTVWGSSDPNSGRPKGHGSQMRTFVRPEWISTIGSPMPIPDVAMWPFCSSSTPLRHAANKPYGMDHGPSNHRLVAKKRRRCPVRPHLWNLSYGNSPSPAITLGLQVHQEYYFGAHGVCT